MNTKRAYTKIFIRESGEALSEENIKLKTRLWWKNNRIREQESLRITDEGLRYITEVLDIKVHEVPFPADLDLKPQVLLYLDKFLDCPYHLTETAITVLSERKAIELHLFSGDVRKYGLIKAMKRELPKTHKTF
jgi:hypothetical protein